MGILDTLKSLLSSPQAGQLEASIIPVVLNEVLGKGDQGGLTAIVNKLQQAGYGDQVKSWLSDGKNIPITGAELQEVLGNAKVKELAAKYGVPIDQLGPILAQYLPKAVDKASPNGTLPHTA
ncbi:MAG: YidB family protein [Xanthobacteraceae bacterium]|nr:YidB family protein [Xanthobacteraceae bacterium]